MTKRFYSERNYKDWMYIKDDVQHKKHLHNFKEWEIWWCTVGENVGVEINGKGSHFMRPVIIFKKFNRVFFTGIPLTTKDHTNEFPDWYVHFTFKGKDEYAGIHQIRNHSAYRLYRKIGELDDVDKAKIYERFLELYKKMPPRIEGCGGKIPNHKPIIARIVGFCKRMMAGKRRF